MAFLRSCPLPVPLSSHSWPRFIAAQPHAAVHTPRSAPAARSTRCPARPACPAPMARRATTSAPTPASLALPAALLRPTRRPASPGALARLGGVEVLLWESASCLHRAPPCHPHLQPSPPPCPSARPAPSPTLTASWPASPGAPTLGSVRMLAGWPLSKWDARKAPGCSCMNHPCLTVCRPLPLPLPTYPPHPTPPHRPAARPAPSPWATARSRATAATPATSSRSRARPPACAAAPASTPRRTPTRRGPPCAWTGALFSCRCASALRLCCLRAPACQPGCRPAYIRSTLPPVPPRPPTHPPTHRTSLTRLLLPAPAAPTRARRPRTTSARGGERRPPARSRRWQPGALQLAIG